MQSGSVPLVSVIIPAFNSERWIEHALSSVVEQTWDNIEIIVVDDGSTDGTADVARKLKDRHTRVISQANRGAGAARNCGLVSAAGDFIQYLDADDMIGPTKLAVQLAALSREPPRSVASCAWARFTVDPGLAVVHSEPVWTVDDPVEWLVESLSGRGMMQPAAWLIPRDVADAAGPWNESLTLHDDGDYFARILANSSRNVFVSEAVVYYRDVPGSLSRRRTRDDIVSALTVARSREATLLSRRDDQAARRAVATQYAQFVYEFGSIAPDLAGSAMSAIRSLGEDPHNVIGGKSFRRLVSLAGFERASTIRARFA